MQKAFQLEWRVLKGVLLTALIALLLSTSVFANPNGGKRRGNPQKLPKLEFPVLMIYLPGMPVPLWII